MAGISGLMSTARSALLAHQRALDVTGQNIANANTAGYTRQRVETAAGLPTRYPYGEFGGGVEILPAGRLRDAFLEASHRQASGDAAASTTRRDALQGIERIIGEPSEQGLSASLDAFWGSWSDLAARPTSGAARAAVQQAGARVALQFNGIAGRLDALATETRQRLGDAVTTANDLARQVAALNRQVVGAESGGTSNSLRDQRDQLLDRLAGLVGADVLERGDGTTAVLIGGLPLVDGTEVRPLAVGTVAGAPAVVRANDPTSAIDAKGEMGALREVLGRTIPDALRDLDALARGVVDRTNALHAQGVTWSGSPPVASPAGNFFDASISLPSATDPLRTARGIRLAPAVLARADAVAASPTGATGPSNGGLALQLAELRTAEITFTDATGAPVTTASAGDYLARIATGVGFAAQSADQQATVDTALQSQTDARRQAVSGVSIDEELVRLIKYQQSYQAAARLVNLADEMARTILDLGR